MDILYSTRVTATGGRHGSIHSDDGPFDLNLALPKVLGGKGGATNPEQLFAGGYAACFENALLHVGRETGHRFADQDIQVTAECIATRGLDCRVESERQSTGDAGDVGSECDDRAKLA